MVGLVPRPLAVPADGGPHKTMVAWFGLDATLNYLTVPRFPRPRPTCRQLSRTAHRYCCSLGPVRIFRDRQFIGETPPVDRRR